jgi:hypothetical protein
MTRRRRTVLKKTLSIAAAVALATVTLAAAPASATHTNGPLVTPTSYPGNFVSSTDNNQVCFDMSEGRFIAEQTGDLTGIKVDPPAPYSDSYISVTLSADGKFLSWSVSGGAEMLAVIVKGGPNFNVYDYTRGPYVGGATPPFSHDNGLQSPAQTSKGKTTVPQISHYNVCYKPPSGEGLNGCTPGYWRNHADRWLGASSSDDFDSTFGVDLFEPDITLGQAVSNPQVHGTLAFHAVAALLNSYGGVPNVDGTTVNYPYTTAQVLALVQAGDKDALAAANELGCPLSGTRAVRV